MYLTTLTLLSDILGSYFYSPYQIYKPRHKLIPKEMVPKEAKVKSDNGLRKEVKDVDDDVINSARKEVDSDVKGALHKRISK